MKINVGKALAREAEEKARVKPLPRIRAKGVIGNQSLVTEVVPQPPINGHPTPIIGNHEKEATLNDLRAQLAQVKRERGKLSTQTAWLVVELEQKLRAESRALANEFIAGNLAMPELVEHYNKIEAFTDKGAVLHEQIEHVERFGVLPAVSEKRVELKVAQDNLDQNAIKYEIRRLDDLIHKKTKNIAKANAGIKTPKNTGRPAQWREMIALAEARRDELKQKLKRINYEAREQRFSVEQG